MKTKKIKIEKTSKLPTDFSVSNRQNERKRGASRSFSRKKLTTLERGVRHAHSVEKTEKPACQNRDKNTMFFPEKSTEYSVDF